MSTFTAGAIALVVVLLGVYFGFAKSLPFRSHYEVNAVFRTSNNIGVNSPVRIAGVDVGRVTKVQPLGPDAQAATVTMRIADRGRPVHADARAKIRPRIFLEGNFFVDLQPGSPSRGEIDDGGTIPITQTATPVQFDQVLQVFRQDTRQDLRTTLGELARTFDAGGAEAFNRSLRDQGPAYRYAAVVSEALLGRRPGDLGRYIRAQGTVSAALDRNPEQLKALITDFARTATALAREEQNLQATFAELPRTLRAASPALAALNGAFPAVRTLAREAVPGVRSSGPAIRALQPLVTQLRGLFSPRELRGLSADLRSAVPGLTTLAQESVPFLRELRLFSSCQNEVILPTTRDTVPDANFPATGPVYQEMVKFLPGLAGESRSFDANTQWFKVLGGGGVETFQLGENFGTALFPIAGVNPPKPAGRPPLRPDVPCETQQQPDLRTIPQEPPTRVDTKPQSPLARARYEKARAVAIEALQAKLGGDAEVLDEDATRETVEQLAARSGLREQLDAVRRGQRP